MKTDALGGKPLVLTLAQLLEVDENRIRNLKTQKTAGQEYTLPTINDDGEITEPQSLDELIANWEKDKARLEEVIAWAEEREPDSSRKGDGMQLLEEYGKLSK